MASILALLVIAAFLASAVMALTSICAVAGPAEPDQSRMPDLREQYAMSSFAPMSNTR